MENANVTPRLRGLGRVPAQDELFTVEDGGSGGGYTPYEVVNTTPVPKSVDDDLVTPVRQVQTMTASTGTASTGMVSLPQFNFATSVESCNDCTPATSATTASALAPTQLVVKPVKMPEAPKTTNWLLIGAALAVGYIVYKSNTPGLAGPEPAAEPQTLGRPPRKAPAKANRHVKELTIS